LLMIITRRDARLEKSSHRRLILLRRTPREQKADDGPDAQRDGNGFVRMFVDGFMRGLGAGDGFVTDVTCKFPALFDQSPDVIRHF
jgi:hypothetical protein